MGPGQLYRFAWVFYLGMALVGIVWIGLREKEIPAALFLGENPLLDLGLGLAAGLALQGAWWVVERLSATARRLQDELSLRLGPITRSEVVALALLSGFSEEFLFRGAIQGSWGLVVATILFGLLHMGPGATLRLWGGFALLAGAVFGGLMLWRINLIAPITAHVVVNTIGLWRLSVSPPEDDAAPPDP